jgi:cysteine synthase A
MSWLTRHEAPDLTAVAIAPDLGERYLDTVYRTSWLQEVYGDDLLDPDELTVSEPAVSLIGALPSINRSTAR